MNEFIGKKIVVVKTDGFKKIGVCKELNESYLILQRFDNIDELIPLSSISSIEEADERGGLNGWIEQ